MRTPVSEAPLSNAPEGRVPQGDGWFIVNVDEARAYRVERFGDRCRFENEEQPFPEFGINVRVLQPGQPACLYHREDAQEAFFVLSGECRAIVEEEERPMRAGDLFYAPAGTRHVLVGAGDGPCAILMVGTRKPDEEIVYPVSPVAARYGASVERETGDPSVAYAGTPWPGPSRMPWPPRA